MSVTADETAKTVQTNTVLRPMETHVHLPAHSPAMMANVFMISFCVMVMNTVLMALMKTLKSVQHLIVSLAILENV